LAQPEDIERFHREQPRPGSSAASVPPANVRRQQMLRVIRGRDFVRVVDLSAMFGISEVTVRSDLADLARSGQVRRVHGGAVSPSRGERPFEETQGAHSTEKTAIGRAAAALVADGDTVILDVGTTTTATAHALLERAELRDVVVFTNALNIAFVLEAATPRMTVVVTGGTLRPLQHSLVDPLGGLILERINANIVFLGCNGIDPVGGVTNINLPEADMKRRMQRAGRRRIVVADGSKVGAVELAPLCDVSEVDLLITGPSADAGIVAALRGRGLDVLVT
jgi:DeoR family transcriptional regulator of aga operon